MPQILTVSVKCFFIIAGAGKQEEIKFKLNGLVLFSLFRQMPTVRSMRNRIAHHLYKSVQLFKSLTYSVSEFGIHDLPRDLERMKT